MLWCWSFVSNERTTTFFYELVVLVVYTERRP